MNESYESLMLNPGYQAILLISPKCQSWAILDSSISRRLTQSDLDLPSCLLAYAQKWSFVRHFVAAHRLVLKKRVVDLQRRRRYWIHLDHCNRLDRPTILLPFDNDQEAPKSRTNRPWNRYQLRPIVRCLLKVYLLGPIHSLNLATKTSQTIEPNDTDYTEHQYPNCLQQP